VRRASNPIKDTDLISGVIAALAFLAMVFALRMELWLGILLAAGIYLAVRLITRKAPHDLPETVTEEELLREIHQLSGTVANPAVRDRIIQILQQARSVLDFLEQSTRFAGTRAQAETWRGIVRECLQSTQRIVQRYAELSRFVQDPNQQSLMAVEELLEQVSGTFTNLGRRLVDEGAADLTAEMDLFRGTLQALNEVNVLNRTGGTQ
jgi:hypothetical protein